MVSCHISSSNRIIGGGAAFAVVVTAAASATGVERRAAERVNISWSWFVFWPIMVLPCRKLTISDLAKRNTIGAPPGGEEWKCENCDKQEMAAEIFLLFILLLFRWLVLMLLLLSCYTCYSWYWYYCYCGYFRCCSCLLLIIQLLQWVSAPSQILHFTFDHFRTKGWWAVPPRLLLSLSRHCSTCFNCFNYAASTQLRSFFLLLSLFFFFNF